MASFRSRPTKIVATLGPASSSREKIRALFDAGADLFRLNFSHGTVADQAARLALIRQIETEVGRPIPVIADLQGPKLRVGIFVHGSVVLKQGQRFRLDLDATPGDERRVQLPHPEIFAVMQPGKMLLLDDGKVRLSVCQCGADYADCEVVAGHGLSDHKGVNVPGVVLPLSALTTKDRADLEAALEMGVDWIALSFVQRPEDMDEARALVKGRADLIAKLEKPSAIKHLNAIVERSDAVMVARGDLGVEMPPEEVPAIQKRVVHEARRQGKPVIVATQMLESMISCPTPTRAEASDVATAVYDGADAVMLSAETASGAYPIEAVSIMDRIACRTIEDPAYYGNLAASHPDLQPTAQDAITSAACQIAGTVQAAAIMAYTDSGLTARRASRERSAFPILGLTSKLRTARRLVLSYGVHAFHTIEITTFSEMVTHAVKLALNDRLVRVGDRVVIVAGVPFGMAGTTNVLRLVWARDTDDPAELAWPPDLSSDQ